MPDLPTEPQPPALTTRTYRVRPDGSRTEPVQQVLPAKEPLLSPVWPPCQCDRHRAAVCVRCEGGAPTLMPAPGRYEVVGRVDRPGGGAPLLTYACPDCIAADPALARERDAYMPIRRLSS